MDECKRMGIPVLGPDINESKQQFTVNKKGHIRFGLGAIKGVGEGAVNAVIEEREKNGPFLDIYNFVERVNLSSVNKKNLEGLALSGGLDCFGLNRSQFFVSENKDVSFLENVLRYGNKFQADKASTQNLLFGGGNVASISKPEPLRVEEWNTLEKLNRGKGTGRNLPIGAPA